MHLSNKRLVCALWKLALLVEDREDAHLLLEQIEAALIVLERNALPLDVLLLVLVLLLLEDERVELLLQLFVGVVDACKERA